MTEYVFRDLSPDFLRSLDGLALDAVADAAGFLLDEANRTIPFDTGVMQDSGRVDAEKEGSGRYAAAVSYNTPYAVRQHEDITLRHKPGRRARWLEMAAAENEARLEKALVERVRKAGR